MPALYQLRILIGETVEVLKGGGKNKEGILTIDLLPSPEGKELSRLQARYQSTLHEYDFNMNEILPTLKEQLLESCREDNLLSSLIMVQRALSSQDLDSIALSFPSEQMAPREQIAMDHFLFGLSCYLTLYSLLLEADYQGELPFPFSLPHPDISIEICSQNTFRYLMYILPNLSLLLDSQNRRGDSLLIQKAIEFINVWEWAFEMGGELNFQQAQNEAFTGYSEVLTRRLGEMLTVKQDIELAIEERLHSVLRQELEGDSLLKDEIQKVINQKCEALAQRYMKHQFTLEARITALEGFAASTSNLLKEIASEHREYQFRIDGILHNLKSQLSDLEGHKLVSL